MAQNTPKRGQTGIWQAKITSTGAFWGVETTKSGGWHAEKVPSESPFGPSGPRYIQSSVSDHGTQSGPRMGQRTRFGGKRRIAHGKKAAHMMPKWILSMKRDTKLHRRQSQSRRARFLVILARFGPWPVRAKIVPFGPTEAQCGQKTRTLGQTRTPKMINWGPKTLLRNPNGKFQNVRNFGASCGPLWCQLRASPVRADFVPFGPTGAHGGRETGTPGPKDGCLASRDPSGGLQNPNGEFRFFGMVVLVASCLLLPAARHASPSPCPNDWTNQYYALQLGDPYPCPYPYPYPCPYPYPYPHRHLAEEGAALLAVEGPSLLPAHLARGVAVQHGEGGPVVVCPPRGAVLGGVTVVAELLVVALAAPDRMRWSTGTGEGGGGGRPPPPPPPGYPPAWRRPPLALH